jgi:hypothetical protein
MAEEDIRGGWIFECLRPKHLFSIFTDCPPAKTFIFESSRPKHLFSHVKINHLFSHVKINVSREGTNLPHAAVGIVLAEQTGGRVGRPDPMAGARIPQALQVPTSVQ